MDWAKINWETVFETWLWTFINLILPLCIIPFAASCYWLKRKPAPWLKIARDGQLCFYAIAILAASGYEAHVNSSKHFVSAMRVPIDIASVCAILYFGLIFSDGDATAGHQRQFDDQRVVALSSFIAVTSAVVAWLTHALAEGAYN